MRRSLPLRRLTRARHCLHRVVMSVNFAFSRGDRDKSRACGRSRSSYICRSKGETQTPHQTGLRPSSAQHSNFSRRLRMDQDQAVPTEFSLNLYAPIGADGGGCPIAGTALFGSRDHSVPLGVANIRTRPEWRIAFLCWDHEQPKSGGQHRPTSTQGELSCVYP
jgi:hypothetical protein